MKLYLFVFLCLRLKMFLFDFEAILQFVIVEVVDYEFDDLKLMRCDFWE